MTSKNIKLMVESLDYSKIRRHMMKTGWKWTSLPGNHFPSEQEMKRVALECVNGLSTYKTSYMSTGGFVAMKIGERGIWLGFCVDDTQFNENKIEK